MSDIVKRLQDMFFRFGTESPDDAANRRIQTAKDAADEIKKLRAALQTARRDALEEAARVADDYALKMDNRAELVSPLYAHIKREFEGRSWVAQTIAVAIRALGEKE